MKETDSCGFRSRHDSERLSVKAKEKSGVKVARLGWLPRVMPLALMVPLVVAAAGTIMYLTALTDPETNAFTIGEAGVEVYEQGFDPDEVAWGEDSKPVQLKNTGSVSGVVRAMLVPVLKDEDGNVVSGNLGSIEEVPTGTTLILGDITLHFADDWPDNWFFQDGYFYYRKVLNPGETTAQLLAGVTLTEGSTLSDLFAEGDIGTVTIEVLADILQTEGDALAEWGVTASASGTVTPV